MMHTLRRGVPAFYRDTDDEERDTRVLHGCLVSLFNNVLSLSLISLPLSLNDTVSSVRPPCFELSLSLGLCLVLAPVS